MLYGGKIIEHDLGVSVGLHGFSWNWLLTGSAFVTTRFSSTLYPRFQYGSLGFSYNKDGSPLLGMPSILGSRTHAMPSCKGTSNQENFSLKRCTMYIRDRFSSLFQNAGLHNLKRFFQSYHQVDINFYLTKNISLCCYGDLTFFIFFFFYNIAKLHLPHHPMQDNNVTKDWE